MAEFHETFKTDLWGPAVKYLFTWPNMSTNVMTDIRDGKKENELVGRRHNVTNTMNSPEKAFEVCKN